MIKPGTYNLLKVAREVDFGLYLTDGEQDILLPKRFVPEGVSVNDEIEVFVYHDSEDRLIATTQKPKGVVGDIVKLQVVSTTPHGAFMDWGLMKDLFVPRSQQISHMRTKGEYLVMIYIDEKTGRVAATEKFDHLLQNESLTVTVNSPVDLVVYRRTDIGYVMIINKQHTGVLHFNEIYRNISVGDHFEGFIKQITPGKNGTNLIDVSLGKRGYERVSSEGEKILSLLQQNNGYLPYSDKTAPEVIYDVFGMSKKTFKMALGNLYKSGRIFLAKEGIKLLDT